MTFLNKELREDMAAALVEHGFQSALKAANTARKEAGDKVYAHIFAAHLDAISSLPDDFFFRGNEFKIGINGEIYGVNMTETKRLHRRCDSWNYRVELFSADDVPEVVKQYIKLNEAHSSLLNESYKAKAQAETALNGVRTFKKLWEVWPECKAILGKFETAVDGKVYLPSVPVQQLNNTFGLPVEGGVQ